MFALGGGPANSCAMPGREPVASLPLVFPAPVEAEPPDSDVAPCALPMPVPLPLPLPLPLPFWGLRGRKLPQPGILLSV